MGGRDDGARAGGPTADVSGQFTGRPDEHVDDWPPTQAPKMCSRSFFAPPSTNSAGSRTPAGTKEMVVVIPALAQTAWTIAAAFAPARSPSNRMTALSLCARSSDASPCPRSSGSVGATQLRMPRARSRFTSTLPSTRTARPFARIASRASGSPRSTYQPPVSLRTIVGASRRGAALSIDPDGSLGLVVQGPLHALLSLSSGAAVAAVGGTWERFMQSMPPHEPAGHPRGISRSTTAPVRSSPAEQ
jgi:hypothetical protein